jgi:hypothetical protein
MVTVVVLSSFIPAIEKSSATNVCKATNQIDWNGCCFTENSNPCAGLTKQPLLQKLPEYSLLSIHSLPLKSTKSRKKVAQSVGDEIASRHGQPGIPSARRAVPCAHHRVPPQRRPVAA